MGGGTQKDGRRRRINEKGIRRSTGGRDRLMHFSGCGAVVALTSRETETRPGTDPGTGFLGVWT